MIVHRAADPTSDELCEAMTPLIAASHPKVVRFSRPVDAKPSDSHVPCLNELLFWFGVLFPFGFFLFHIAIISF